MFMSFTIGGKIKRSIIPELLATVKNEVSEITGPTTEEEFLTEAHGQGRDIEWQGMVNYGEPDELKVFCEKHDISYIHRCGASFEYGASIAFWTPGMEKEKSYRTSHDGELSVDVNLIRPYVALLLEYAKHQEKCLGAFVGIPTLESIVQKGLQNPKTIIKNIEKAVNILLPEEPSIPPLTLED